MSITPQEQMQSAEITAETLSGVNDGLEQALEGATDLVEGIDASQHPDPAAAAQTIRFHINAAASMAANLAEANREYHADGMERYQAESGRKTQRPADESTDFGGDRRELVEQIARALAGSGFGSGTIVVVRTEVEDESEDGPGISLH